MRGIVISLVLVALVLWGLRTLDHNGNTYYVQLVRGTDTDQPPSPGSERVGPKLLGTFGSAFRLRNYWEVMRREVSVAPGHVARVRLSDQRVVEIDLSDQALRKVTAFSDGELVDRISKPRGEAMTIIGGNRDGNSVWFIVVRRDKPLNP
ncbi:hypothetical protein SBV1_240002 [Verrucomicrobia bacterium]|nr:hypothetical protein SBV1_240002 [Verrucomicrobiota bacterium]